MRKWIKGSIADTILLNSATIFVAGIMGLISSYWFWVAGLVATAALWVYRWWVIRTDETPDKAEATTAVAALTDHRKEIQALRAALGEEIASMERGAFVFKDQMRPEVAISCMDRYRDLSSALYSLGIHLPHIKEVYGSNRSMYSPHEMRTILQGIAKYTATGDVAGARKAHPPPKND